MAQYTINVQATSNTVVNTEDVFIELKAPASVIFKVKRVRVGFSDGTDTAGVDNHFRIKLARWDTTTGGSATTGTAIIRNANLPAAVTTLKVKTTTTALALGTTNVTVIDLISVNGRALYEWLARDDDDMIIVKPASCFAVVLQSSVVSQKFTVTVDWVE
ncbi:MAG TPA: hypothetical protein VLG09_05210 [Candidatus Saccharimonadales bacterium]|nr:hypothetical protein [Candidatus Saccharimonadales bacterium]